MKFIIRQCAPQLGFEYQLVSEDGHCTMGNMDRMVSALYDAAPDDEITFLTTDGREERRKSVV